jgi:colicin import membrane protein
MPPTARPSQRIGAAKAAREDERMSAVMPRLGRRDALMPRRPDGLGRGLMLAIAVHIGLVIALAIGVHWRSREPETVAAELWSAVPQVAAPRAVEPEPPKAQPAPPKPQVQPPKLETPAPQQRDADIAIEKARREKEEEAHRAQEQAHREREEQRRQQLEAQQRAAEKAAAEKAARERAQQAEAEARRKQQAEAEARKKQEQQEQREAALRAELRQKQLERMMGQANASGDARSTGRAQQSSGPSASYAGRIRAVVRPNIVFNDDLEGNPVAEVEVRLAPDGTILGTPRLAKSSGSKGWDDAVIRALVKTETLPRDVDGRVPTSMVIAFRPRE